MFGGPSIWHFLVMLLIVVGIPALIVWLAIRAARRGASASIAARLLELGQLRDKGLVTPEEFERKRSELAKEL